MFIDKYNKAASLSISPALLSEVRAAINHLKRNKARDEDIIIITILKDAEDHSMLFKKCFGVLGSSSTGRQLHDTLYKRNDREDIKN